MTGRGHWETGAESQCTLHPAASEPGQRGGDRLGLPRWRENCSWLPDLEEIKGEESQTSSLLLVAPSQASSKFSGTSEQALGGGGRSAQIPLVLGQGPLMLHGPSRAQGENQLLAGIRAAGTEAAQAALEAAGKGPLGTACELRRLQRCVFSLKRTGLPWDLFEGLREAQSRVWPAQPTLLRKTLAAPADPGRNTGR